MTCTTCRQWVTSHSQETLSLVVFARSSDGAAELHFAHEGCSPSRQITVDVLPGDVMQAAPEEDNASGMRLRWAFAVREGVMPMVMLAVDVEHLEQMSVSGDTLLEALRIDGFASGRSTEAISPPLSGSVIAYRDEGTLFLETEQGTEALALTAAGLWEPPLRVAAHRGGMLLILGPDLKLDRGDFSEVDSKLSFGSAVAGRVAYRDPELADRPLGRPTPPKGLMRLVPSARRRYRRHKRLAG